VPGFETTLQANPGAVSSEGPATSAIQHAKRADQIQKRWWIVRGFDQREAIIETDALRIECQASQARDRVEPAVLVDWALLSRST
jgi:hypothetical protein